MQTSHYNTAASPASSILLSAVICSAILLATLPGGNKINLAVSIIFVGMILFNTIAGKRALWFSKELFVLLVWLCYSVIGLTMAMDIEAAMFKSLTMLQVLTLAFCVQQAVIWSKGSISSLVTYGVAIGISYLLTFTQFNAQEAAGSEVVKGNVSRVASTLTDENTFGAVSLMGFSLIMISIAKNNKNFLYVPLSLLLALLFLAVVNSGSRTAFTGAIVILLGSVWSFSLWKTKIFTKFFAYMMAMILLLMVVFPFSKLIPEADDRVDAVFSKDSLIFIRTQGFIEVLLTGDTRAEHGNSIDARVEMISDGLEVISDNPIFGVGLDNFRSVTGAGTYAHSNLVEVASSTGVVGLIIYYIMYAVLTIRILKWTGVKGADGVVSRLILVGLIAFFIMDITRVSYYEKTSWIYFAIVSALIETISRNAKTEIEPFTHRRKRKKRRKPSVKKAAIQGNDKSNEFEDIDELFQKK